MSQADHVQRRGCRGGGRVMLFVVLAAALILVGVAVYTLIDRPTTNRLTPAGANYNPGQTQDAGGSQ